MNKYIGMVILKPDIKERRIEQAQSKIIHLFEQETKLNKVWYLGKKNLEFKNKKYTEGLYLKLEILAKPKKIEQLKKQLKQNQDIIFSMIINNDNDQKSLQIIDKFKNFKLPFSKNQKYTVIPQNIKTQHKSKEDKVYMLINRHGNIAFSETDILQISKNEETILQYASRKMQELVYVKGYRTLTPFKIITELENQLKRTGLIRFTLDNNPNIVQELIVKPRNLV